MIKDVQKEVTYTLVQYTNDEGWWTVRRVTVEDIAKAPSSYAAERLVADMGGTRK